MSNHKIILVKPEHIQPGINKYNGQIDPDLIRHLKNANMDFLPYVFDDGRVLMVLEMMNTAFLYPSRKAVFDTLLKG